MVDFVLHDHRLDAFGIKDDLFSFPVLRFNRDSGIPLYIGAVIGNTEAGLIL